MRGVLLGAIGCVFAAMAAAAAPAIEEAQALIAKGQFEQALGLLDHHLKSAPQDAEARFKRGLVLVRLNRNDDAAAAFAGLTRDFPELPEAYNNLAVVYAQQGEYDKARKALEDSLAARPSYALGHENLGNIYAALSAASYKRALTLDPGNASVRAKLDLVSRLDILAERDVAAAPGAAAVPAAASVPPTAPAPAAGTADAAAIGQVVQSWAAAWSAKDAERYLSFYADDFAPEGGVSRLVWEVQRRQRIARPREIRVAVSELQVQPLGPGRAQVTFRQDYRSDAISNQSTKVLVMAQARGQWRIRREYSRR